MINPEPHRHWRLIDGSAVLFTEQIERALLCMTTLLVFTHNQAFARIFHVFFVAVDTCVPFIFTMTGHTPRYRMPVSTLQYMSPYGSSM